MRTKLLFLSLSLSVGACKWTEFDDLQDQAWVKAITKPDGSKSNNWGVGIVRGKQASASGGVLAVFGNAQARLNEVTLAADGVTAVSSSWSM